VIRAKWWNFEALRINYFMLGIFLGFHFLAVYLNFPVKDSKYLAEVTFQTGGYDPIFLTVLPLNTIN